MARPSILYCARIAASPQRAPDIAHGALSDRVVSLLSYEIRLTLLQMILVESGAHGAFGNLPNNFDARSARAEIVGVHGEACAMS